MPRKLTSSTSASSTDSVIRGDGDTKQQNSVVGDSGLSEGPDRELLNFFGISDNEVSTSPSRFIWKPFEPFVNNFRLNVPFSDINGRYDFDVLVSAFPDWRAAADGIGLVNALSAVFLYDRRWFSKISHDMNDLEMVKYMRESDLDWSFGRRRVFLVRHGQYKEVINRKTGICDGPLTDNGRQQLQATAAHLVKLTGGSIRMLVSSQMQRALESAEFMVTRLSFDRRVMDDAINEGWPSIPEPRITVNLVNPRSDAARMERGFQKYMRPPTRRRNELGEIDASKSSTSSQESSASYQEAGDSMKQQISVNGSAGKGGADSQDSSRLSGTTASTYLLSSSGGSQGDQGRDSPDVSDSAGPAGKERDASTPMSGSGSLAGSGTVSGSGTLSGSGSEVREVTDVIVAHSNLFRFWICRLLQIDSRAWARVGLDFGSITEVVLDSSGKVEIRRIGDSSHIPLSILKEGG